SRERSWEAMILRLARSTSAAVRPSCFTASIDCWRSARSSSAEWPGRAVAPLWIQPPRPSAGLFAVTLLATCLSRMSDWYRREVQVADQDERGVVGPVVLAEERADVVQRGALDLGDHPDDALVVWVRRGIEQIAEPLLRRTVRDVVHALALLVAHHVALDLQLLLVQGGEQEAHPVALQPQR